MKVSCDTYVVENAAYYNPPDRTIDSYGIVRVGGADFFELKDLSCADVTYQRRTLYALAGFFVVVVSQRKWV